MYKDGVFGTQKVASFGDGLKNSAADRISGLQCYLLTDESLDQSKTIMKRVSSEEYCAVQFGEQDHV
jgi:hypothetical protein